MVSPRLRGLWLVLLLLLASLATYLTTRQDAERAAESSPLRRAPAVADAVAKGGEPVQREPIEVEMTAYTSEASQTDATPNLTARVPVPPPPAATF